MSEDEMIGLWDIFKPYLSEKNKHAAALRYANYLMDEMNISLSELESLIGNDDSLDDAITEIVSG